MHTGSTENFDNMMTFGMLGAANKAIVEYSKPGNPEEKRQAGLAFFLVSPAAIQLLCLAPNVNHLTAIPFATTRLPNTS